MLHVGSIKKKNGTNIPSKYDPSQRTSKYLFEESINSLANKFPLDLQCRVNSYCALSTG